MYLDDGCGYVLGSSNDLLDSGHTQGDIHASNTSKMESLESHLGSWLSNALCPKGTNSGPWIATHLHCAKEHGVADMYQQLAGRAVQQLQV